MQARRVEDMIIQMAKKGQVQGQVNESYLKQMLESIEVRRARHVPCV